MWFDDSMMEAYDNGIAPAIRDAGYEPIRIDRKDHNNKIDDEIIAEIRRSRFLVADFTQGGSGARGGVYYEAGFAHGLNIPVIFTCREDVIDKVHFDTRQYNHITWAKSDQLRDRLAKRISATLGDGPMKKATL
jgi:nucleoside 2-deoxyribosyltransferase